MTQAKKYYSIFEQILQCHTELSVFKRKYFCMCDQLVLLSLLKLNLSFNAIICHFQSTQKLQYWEQITECFVSLR